jgi:hypothetical protein
MKLCSIFFVVAAGFCISSSFYDADDYLTSKSPDGKFALHVSRGDKQPFPQSSETASPGTAKSLWKSSDDAAPI